MGAATLLQTASQSTGFLETLAGAVNSLLGLFGISTVGLSTSVSLLIGLGILVAIAGIIGLIVYIKKRKQKQKILNLAPQEDKGPLYN
ncbi:hypothetical protein NEOKW01_1888 [Nematocida sp. AWRm80]|nr:hypothetical protein NEOKW01_1888 [Nematocida sp. AWRm80]